MDALISVIMPIYKVEQYLCRAVDSVCAQTYSNLEIILVEDGSPDGCGAICDSYAQKDQRIVVIHKENGGLSDARNAGLDKMTGDYVVFVDSDDYIAPYFVEELYRGLTEADASVSFCQYATVVKKDTSELEKKLHRPVKAEFPKPQEMYVYDRQKLLSNLYDFHHEDATFFIVSWNKLYKASLWKNIRFPKGKIHEDEATTYKIFDAVTTGVYVKAPMYAYFQAPSSITRDAFSVKRFDWMDALTDRIRFFEKRKEKEQVEAALRARADGAIKYYYFMEKNFPQRAKYAKRLKGYVKEALNRIGTYQKLTLRNKFGYYLFLLSPGLYKIISKR